MAATDGITDRVELVSLLYLVYSRSQQNSEMPQ